MTDVATPAAAESDSLSAEETAYFESRGEKAEAPAETPEKQEPEKQPVEAVKPDDDVKMEPDETEETVEVENKGRFVRHGAFHKERVMRKQEQEARKALEVQLSQRNEAFARADERLKLLSEAMMPRAEDAKPEDPPDPEQDIFGYVKWQAKQIAQLNGKLGESAKVSEAERSEQQLRQSYQSDALRFAQEQKDFGDAYSFLIKGRDAELQAYGVSDPAERAQMIVEEERGLVARAVKDNASPAQRVYALAKARGYAPKAAEEPKDKAAAKSPVVEQLENIQRGQSAAKTLSSAGGSPSDALTAEALANMSEEDFAIYLAKTPKSQQRALMGG